MSNLLKIKLIGYISTGPLCKLRQTTQNLWKIVPNWLSLRNHRRHPFPVATTQFLRHMLTSRCNQLQRREKPTHSARIWISMRICASTHGTKRLMERWLSSYRINFWQTSHILSRQNGGKSNRME